MKETLTTETGCQVAVIGLCGRFPGGRDIDEFWENLKNGVETISFSSDEEVETLEMVPGVFKETDYVKASATINEIEYFDASFFGYSPKEAEIMDPQMRIFHECIWEALENAGYDPFMYKGLIGLYSGAAANHYWEGLAILSGTLKEIGNLKARQLLDKDYLSARISYKLGLKGPSFMVTSSCSTSLVTIHLAYQALLNGECDIALAGGISIDLSEGSGYQYEEGMVHSQDGHCRAFDAKTNGTVFGDGVGVVVLKRLEEAIEDRDYIYAVIISSCINNDGNRKVGFNAPSIEGQAEVIQAALQMAEVKPESISYIETHGTGTSLGDPIEITAIKLAFNTNKKGFCRIGSVKTNIGHLNLAAGAAGFIKTVLALKHQLIPPSLHFETANPKIDFDNSPFVVNTELYQWKRSGYPLRAGVSSFGMGGTNAHVILEEWPMAPEVQRKAHSAARKEHGSWSQARDGFSPPDHTRDYQLILLSAKTQTALEKMTTNLAGHLKKNPDINLEDAAYTLQLGRKAFRYRRMLVCSQVHDAIERLSWPGPGKVRTFHSKEESRPIVFMFPGLGSQYVNMGRELYEKKMIFQQEMNHCFEILKPLLDYDIKEILYPGGSLNFNKSSRSNRSYNSYLSYIHRIEIAQVVVFILEYALAKLLMKWGITPQAMIGYSFGEYTAACLSGIFSLEDTLKLIVSRGQLIRKIPTGAMLSVPLLRDELIPLIEDNDELSIAIDNGPSCIVAGPAEPVSDFENRMKEKKYLCMRLKTTYAIHSKMMDPILREFEKEIRQIPVNKPQIPFISNVTGAWITTDQAANPTYWVKQLRETVKFAAGINRLLKEENTIFIEIGPGHDLKTLMTRHISDHSRQKVINLVPAAEKKVSHLYYLLDRIGQLWLYGAAIYWQGFYGEKNKYRYRVPLPTYPFERQRYWIDINKPLEISQLRQSTGEDTVNEFTSKYNYQREELNSQYEPPENRIEQTLTNIWQEFLGIEQVGIYDDFFELGMDSLVFITISSKIHKVLHVKIPLQLFFSKPTIKELAGYIRDAQKDICFLIEPVEEKEYYELSSAQKRLYFLKQMDSGSTTFNIHRIIVLNRDRMAGKDLEETFRKLIQRHESLRTSFLLIAGEPVQRIHDKVEFEVEYDWSLVEEEEPSSSNCQGRGEVSSPVEIKRIIRDFIRPFDLSRAPLVRAGLINTGEANILILDMHHIISDGISLEILTKEFLSLDNGEELKDLRLRYKDYAVWQNSENRENTGKKQENFWLENFAGEIPGLSMPIDYERPPVQDFEGALLYFELGKKETRKLRNFAKENDATLYITILSIFYILLSKLSGQEDIVVGTFTAGRKHVDTENIIGMFVNTIALRNYPAHHKFFKEFFKEIKEHTLEAFENQEYPFEELVNKVLGQRDPGRNPIFDVMLNMLNHREYQGDTPGAGEYDLSKHTKNPITFDLVLTAVEYEEQLFFRLEYSTRLFKTDTIDRLINYFKNVTASILENPYRQLGDIEILSQEEKRELLELANGVQHPLDINKTIHGLFQDKVKEIADQAAVIFNSAVICYNELNRRANRLAGILRAKGVISDTIVGLLVERSLEMIIGIIAIMKAGGAYLPIDPRYPGERKQYMLTDSNVKLLLTNSEMESVPVVARKEIDILNISDANIYNKNAVNLGHGSRGANLVYVIYTSGSTGNPKGVMIEHKNVVNLVKYDHQYTNIDCSKILQFHTIGFDASFHEIFCALLFGGQLVLIDNHTLSSTAELFKLVEKQQIKTLFLPMSYLKLVFREEDNIKLIPGGVEHIQTAGEQVIIIDRFKKYLLENDVYLHNHYGPSETHVVTTLTLVPHGDIPGLPSIGRPVSNTGIYILDKANRLQAVGVQGELYVGGVQVGRGYSNNPDLTNDKYLINSQIPIQLCIYATMKHLSPTHYPITPLPHHPIYRTGDLARWLADGKIEFLGRSDSQVKIRGFRIEPGEIESHLLNCREIREAVVLAREDDSGDKFLAAYIAADNEIDVPGLRDYLSGKLPDYMIPSYFMQIDRIPLTPNGKIDKRALPFPGLTTRRRQAAPRNTTEKKLVSIWSEVLDIEKKTIGIDDNFFHLGGHSLKAIALTTRIQNQLATRVSLIDIFKLPTIRRLSGYIKEAGKDKYTAIEPVEKKEYYSLSSAQKRLYILQQMDLKNTGYHLSQIVTLPQDIPIEKIKQTFNKLVARHEILRTSFEMKGEEPVQKIHNPVELEIECDASTMKNFIRPFDLSQAPLLRVGLVKPPHPPSALRGHPRRGTYTSQEGRENKYLLIVDMHHIITDGGSQEVLIKEFMSLSTGEELVPLNIQYRDYSEWRNSKEQQDLIKQQEAYWLDLFPGELPVLSLPIDYPRPQIQSFTGSKIRFVIDEDEKKNLMLTAREEDATLYMCILSIYTILLSKLAGQEDIIVGIPLAARRHTDLEHMVGMFVNTLPTRNYPSGEKTFSGFLKEVKNQVINVLDNQEYPFEELVDKILVSRDTSRNPIFDVIFNLLDFSGHSIGFSFSGDEKKYKYVNINSRFDMSLTSFIYEDKLLLELEYCTKLFKEESIKRFAGYLQKIASSVAADSTIRIADVEMISPEEKQRILSEFNDTKTTYPADKTVHQLFKEQVEKTPYALALVFEGKQLTYKELDVKANRLAGFLKKKGVSPGGIVAVMVDRSPEMLVGLLGIMKAGGAYLPIEPDYPARRTTYILEDSGTGLLLGQEDLTDESLYGTERKTPGISSNSNDLAYVTYTSGSTGKPKGVMIEHRSVINFIAGITRLIPFGKRDRILSFTTVTFDIFVLETFLPLTRGSRVVIGSKTERLDSRAAAWLIEREQITIFQVTPSRLQLMIPVAEAVKSLGILKYLLVGGETFPAALLEKTSKIVKGKIYNLYGPTETTVWSTVKDLTGAQAINIGKPIANTIIYILNRSGKVQPVGVPGELYIAGDGTARGYLNNPELTAESFCLRRPGGSFYKNRPLDPCKNFLLKGLDKNYIQSCNHTSMQFHSYFSQYTNSPIPHSTIYHTGDLARWFPDGNIEFLGRVDHQVKVRGSRIELGEIESRLLAHADVRETVVITKEDENREKYLCAYITSDRKLTVPELRDYLSEELPEYMIPSHFRQLETMPLTANGKVDRKALESQGTNLDTGSEYLAPRTEIEKRIAETWKKVLEIHKVGLNDNFFDLGGNSIKVIRLNNRLQEVLEKEIPVVIMYRHLTISSFVSYLSQEEANDVISDRSDREIDESIMILEASNRLLMGEEYD